MVVIVNVDVVAHDDEPAADDDDDGDDDNDDLNVKLEKDIQSFSHRLTLYIKSPLYEGPRNPYGETSR